MGEIFNPPLIQAQSWEEAQRKFNEALQQIARMLNSIYTGANIPNTRLVAGTKIDGVETGADVTADHEAATIASQGDLAVLDEVTSGEVNISQLSDISPNIGTETSGTITTGLTINGSLRKIYDYVVSGSAITSVTLSGLDGDTDVEYKIRCRWVAGDVCDFALRFNADTGNNYGVQAVWGTGTTAAANRATSQAYHWWGESDSAGPLSHAQGHLYAKSGEVRTTDLLVSREVSGTTILYGFVILGVWDNSADNITSITFLSSAASGIDVGSHIEVWKRVA